MRWICCQLRAREHFLVPVGFHRRGVLARLVTDIWAPPGRMTAALVPRLRDLYHPELEGRVTSFNVSALAFEAAAAAGPGGWPRMMRRNAWFQEKAVAALQRERGTDIALFSYSYAAGRLFEYAKSRGWKTVLGQIDPGFAEEQLVAKLQRDRPGVEAGWQPAPAEYWQRWRAELELADRIVVNSSWSRDGLIAAGAPREKLVIVPLAYEGSDDAAAIEKTYPARFTNERPLRVLFLGQIVLRKGIDAVLEAAQQLKDEPIEFIVAGPNAIDSAVVARNTGRIRWIGSVPRGRTAAVYSEADVFLFPTRSDGFGLTQLEAQASRLPIIASEACGQVVRPGINGVLLRDGSGQEIANVLRDLLANPQSLAKMSAASRVDEQHRPERFAAAVQESLA